VLNRLEPVELRKVLLQRLSLNVTGLGVWAEIRWSHILKCLLQMFAVFRVNELGVEGVVVIQCLLSQLVLVSRDDLVELGVQAQLGAGRSEDCPKLVLSFLVTACQLAERAEMTTLKSRNCTLEV